MRRVSLFLLVAFAYLAFLATGRTFNKGYMAMRRLHARTDGRFNDAVLALWRRLAPARPQPVRGFLGSFTVEELVAIAGAVERDGLVVLDRRLPEAACLALERFARATPCRAQGATTDHVYEGRATQALRHDFAPDVILRSAEACRIVYDGTLAAIAAAYFRCRPVFDFVSMWWTTAEGPRDYSAAAQMFHYDMDRVYFLKFFVYLTDVTAETGPHVFVAGSHRRKPRALRADRRYEDAEVAAHFPAERMREITGPRGTVFIADTRGLHKGKPVVHGERLVLQAEFALNRFGQNYDAVGTPMARLAELGVAAPDRRTFPDAAT
jgi:Phytanoyl-CoA dioxygenase (PhyH)